MPLTSYICTKTGPDHSQNVVLKHHLEQLQSTKTLNSSFHRQIFAVININALRIQVYSKNNNILWIVKCGFVQRLICFMKFTFSYLPYITWLLLRERKSTLFRNFLRRLTLTLINKLFDCTLTKTTGTRDNIMFENIRWGVSISHVRKFCNVELSSKCNWATVHLT